MSSAERIEGLADDLDLLAKSREEGRARRLELTHLTGLGGLGRPGALDLQAIDDAIGRALGLIHDPARQHAVRAIWSLTDDRWVHNFSSRQRAATAQMTIGFEAFVRRAGQPSHYDRLRTDLAEALISVLDADSATGGGAAAGSGVDRPSPEHSGADHPVADHPDGAAFAATVGRSSPRLGDRDSADTGVGDCTVGDMTVPDTTVARAGVAGPSAQGRTDIGGPARDPGSGSSSADGWPATAAGADAAGAGTDHGGRRRRRVVAALVAVVALAVVGFSLAFTGDGADDTQDAARPDAAAVGSPDGDPEARSPGDDLEAGARDDAPDAADLSLTAEGTSTAESGDVVADGSGGPEPDVLAESVEPSGGLDPGAGAASGAAEPESDAPVDADLEPVACSVVPAAPHTDLPIPAQQRLLAEGDAIVALIDDGECAAGRVEMFVEAIVQEVALGAAPAGAVIWAPDADPIRLTEPQWLTYRQVMGRNRPENAADFAGYPIARLSIDPPVFEMSAGGILAGARADQPHFWIPALGQGRQAWEDAGGLDGLGLPTSNPHLVDGVWFQTYERGAATTAQDFTSTPAVEFVDDPSAPLAELGDLRGQVLRQPTGEAWFVDDELRRHWIPDGDTWFCVDAPNRWGGVDVPGYAVATLEPGPPATCDLVETAG